ncbi:hypothetical protein CC78DRAFT_593728 [Lojkania enalia]|uniref:PARP catalytic domain-containing protein n=1 Tax=Lojkania enalia TaxID=147567 RepID=A0A9P4N6A1_9PLEO|nr:hypothetical protein CC78DRAFT_593728 [Didymosphaeria enalia]
MSDYIVKPQITFHGTRRDSMASIVQFGFLKLGGAHPITGAIIATANGRSYGKGIYSSPEAWFCIYYSDRGERHAPSELPGIKIIICATIMGRAALIDLQDSQGVRDNIRPIAGADNHADESRLQYVVFDSAAILPCIALHLNLAKTSEAEIDTHIIQLKRDSKQKKKKDGFAFFAPRDKQRLKEERIAKARKFFAYGFGPIGGRNIVIEDIAEVDDDEEDYGDYQVNRIMAESHSAKPRYQEWEEGA